MGLSRLAKKCQKCPFASKCKNKRMESAAAPVLRETMEIRVNGKPVIVYKDEIEKGLYKSLYSGLDVQLGG